MFFFRLSIKLALFIIFILSLSILYERAKFDIRPLVQVNPIEKTQTYINQKKYADAYEYLNYFMQFDYVKNNPEATKLLEEIKQHRSQLSYQTKKALEGALKGISDEPIGNTAAIISDFFLFGDLRDLVIQGKNYFDEKEVDEVIVTLSAVGVIATATTYATAGTSSAAKAGISTLKLARRANKLPTWLGRYMKSMLPLMRQSKSIKPVKPIFNNIQILHKQVGTKNTLTLLSHTKNYKALPSLVKITTKYGKQTPVLLKLAGKNSINLLSSIKSASRSSVMYASSFGKRGLEALSKLGSKTFLLRMGKTAYKGNLDFVYDYLVKNLPTYILVILSIVLGFYFFYPRIRKH